MRHQRTGRDLGRNSSHRKALLRNMVTSLFKHEQLETTDAKAKELRPVAEKMITLAKRGDLHARRAALSYIKDKPAIHKLFDELKGRYVDRQGGYIRIIKKGIRKGDGAPISIIQLLPADEGKKKVKTTEKTKVKTKVKTKGKTKGKTKATASESPS
jgi:large subunit ribosomal protein L17